MTEHVEGDPCKFALWSGRTPSSDNKTVLKVSVFCLFSLPLALLAQALGALNERSVPSLLILTWLPYLPVGSCLHGEQLSSEASVATGTVVQPCWNCISYCSLVEQLHTDTGQVSGCLAGRCNSLIPLPLGLSTTNLFHRPPELTACSVKWVSAEESIL